MDWREQNDAAEVALANARSVSTTGYARANCPFCLSMVGKEDRKQCLSLNVTTGFYKCWRCHTHGRLARAGGEWTPAPPTAPTTQGPPDGFMELAREPARSALCAEDARAYLRRRGLDDETVWEVARIGCCVDGRYAGRVIVPVLSPADEWWGWVGRAWVKKADRPYLNAPGMSLGGGMWNHAALQVETDQPVLVMEGVFDALAYWPDAVAVLGKPTPAQVESMKESSRPIVVVLDGDAWEEAMMLALRLRFEGKHAGHVRLPPCTDPDEVDHAWLIEQAHESLDEAAVGSVEAALGG